nr:HD domain-containing protein [Spirochaeta sp.]
MARRTKTTDRSTQHIIWQEAIRPSGYVLAAVVGTILTLTRRFESIAGILPFIVPFLVGLFTRVTGRLAARRRELLLDLPSYRQDPAFIVDFDGSITASTGKTEALFRANEIEHLDQFLAGKRISRTSSRVDAALEAKAPDVTGGDGGERSGATGDGAPASARLLAQDPPSPDDPFYSPVTGKWYRAQVLRETGRDDCLVWLDDVTERVHLEERRDALRTFTRKLQKELVENEAFRDKDERLAELLLSEGYQAVMLARVDKYLSQTAPDRARGVLYTNDGRRADPIPIPTDADAPIMRSRRDGRAIWDDIESYASAEEFRKHYPVLPDVNDFIGTPIRNLANYHSGDVSIIAFNKAGKLTATDIAVLESVADTAVTAFSLLDLAHRADHRFIQSIHGVCAAAEYSDEITGGHIWRVNDYSRHIAQTLGMHPRVQNEIGIVAAMHDIGKVAIPHLIKLPRALSAAEREQMQLHTVYGAQIIDRMRRATDEEDSRLAMAHRIALHHHQQWNGSGYPALVNATGTVVDPTSRDSSAYRGYTAPSGDT